MMRPVGFLLVATLASACGRGNTTPVEESAATVAIEIETAPAIEQPIARFIAATGTLTAQDAADVAAEIAGRVVATPVERGTPVALGAELIRIAASEVEAQAQEADANVAQIQARLGQIGDGAADGRSLQIDRVPEVASAKATHDLAQADFRRSQMLLDKQLIAQSEFELRRAQVETTRRQYETARNNALQQNEALAAARARVALARKALADTVVRSPFEGVVSERLVSIGDYVTRGTKVATVLRINPLRVELSVPAQHMAVVAAGREVSFAIDAYPGRTFTGIVRYVSPDVRAASRSLIVEALVPNADGMLKPGLFATAQIEEATTSRGILVPSAAVRTLAGTSRVFVVSADKAEERIVTVGAVLSDRPMIEVTTGLKAGEIVATSNVHQLVDGATVRASRPAGSADVGRALGPATSGSH